MANAIPRASIKVELVALMRYAAQNDAIPVPLTLPLDPAYLRQEFLKKHRELFGYATAERCVIESIRVQARQPSTTDGRTPRHRRQGARNPSRELVRSTMPTTS